MEKKIIFAFASILILFCMSCSEDKIDDQGFGIITGKIVKKGTNEPLENVKIATNPSTSTVFSDAEGVYTLQNVPIGDYSLSAEKEGLLAHFEGVTILTDKEIELVIEMEEETANNKPPETPTLITPLDNAQDQPLNVALIWSSTDPDEDELIYTVTLRNDQNQEIEVYENILDTTFTLENLSYYTKYFWQVSVNDGVNGVVNSETFAFETTELPNNRIIYVQSDEGNQVIFSANESGDSSIQLTPSSKNSFRPRVNSQTNKIAFLRTVGTQTHIYTMEKDGSNEKQVTSQISVSGNNFEELDFAWTGQGASLVFPNQNKLYRINSDGSGLQLVYQTSDNRLISAVAVNQVTGRIALKTNNLQGYDIKIFTIENGIEDDVVLDSVNGGAGTIDFSIDGKKILYTYDNSGFENDNNRKLDSRIFLYNLLDGSLVDVSLDKDDGTNDLDARFSPNGASVIFTNTSNDGISKKTIYTMSLSNLEQRNILIDDAMMPDWE